tara:strand:- start:1119 stop:1358 length:240 start_codon:yes stop_codon:yes gene_type:complete
MYRTFYNDFFDMFDSPQWYRNSLTPSTVYVVSEEKIKELELKKQERTIQSIDDRIEELQTYRKSIEESLTGIEYKKEDV